MSELSSASPSTPLEPRRRFFTDAEGTPWEVREAKNPDYDRRAGYSLIFESSGCVRRVRNYPTGWFDLPVHALRELNERT